jgi:hypothetical protein
MKNTYINEFQRLRKLAGLINEDETVLGTKGVIPLSKIPKDAALAAIDAGKNDADEVDDTAKFKKSSVPASKLRASQTEIIPSKAVGLAVSMILKKGNFKEIGGDLGAIASNDNYIMDGHHRWAATMLANPKANVVITFIDLPAQKLVSVLNVITAAKGRSGNPGKGNIKTFTGDVIGKVIDEFAEKGDGNNSAEEVKDAVSTVGNGDFNKGKEVMMKNADALPKDIMPGAPDRIDMPVVNSDEIAKVAKDIQNGTIDYTGPYSSEVKSKLKVDHVINIRPLFQKEFVSKKLDHKLFESVLKHSISEFSKVSKRKK